MSEFISIPKREWEGRCYLVAVTPDIDVEPGDWVVCTNIEALPPGWLRLIHGVTIRALESKRAGELCKFAVPTRDKGHTPNMAEQTKAAMDRAHSELKYTGTPSNDGFVYTPETGVVSPDVFMRWYRGKRLEEDCKRRDPFGSQPMTSEFLYPKDAGTL